MLLLHVTERHASDKLVKLNGIPLRTRSECPDKRIRDYIRVDWKDNCIHSCIFQEDLIDQHMSIAAIL